MNRTYINDVTFMIEKTIGNQLWIFNKKEYTYQSNRFFNIKWIDRFQGSQN